MAKIKLTVNGETAKATVTDGILTHGAVGVVVDVAVSGEQWDGIPYKVVCVCNGVAREALVIDGAATVPPECLIGGYMLLIGIDGSNEPGTLRIPTVMDSCGTVAKSTASYDPKVPTPPTPDIYAQIMAAIESGKIKGDDGFSPTVGVMIIDGGHRVTITDKEGEHSFDVLNGKLTDADREAIAKLIPAYDDTEIKREQIALKEGLSQCSQLLPEAAPVVGKVLKVLSVNPDGTFTCEWDDGGSGGVTDVQLNGVSVVTDGVAAIPFAGNDNGDYGVVTASDKYGIRLWSKAHPLLCIARASDAEVKNPVGATMTYKPIVASTEHAAAFYGLAKAAGDTTQSASANAVGTYTPEAQAAIQQMIGFRSTEGEVY